MHVNIAKFDESGVTVYVSMMQELKIVFLFHFKVYYFPQLFNQYTVYNALVDISNAFKSLKIGKACGVDGVPAEHLLYAHDILHVFLSLLFTSFITHGHLSSNFMKTALVPIIKSKTGDTSDKNNYRPIALVTAASKIFGNLYSGSTRNVLNYT